MPIYEYDCRACERTFELRRSISAMDGEARCPRCGQAGTRRMSLPSLVAAGGPRAQGGGGGGCCGGGCCGGG